MIELRRFAALGGADHGWLNTRHHFSFADYHDPQRMHWGALRVWNDDVIAPKSGFPPHPHRDMEIITYVTSGAITHKDSLGNTGRTEAGDVQVMSAGTGITHAEYNMEEEETRLFQLWILPDHDKIGSAPRWDAKPFPRGDRAGRWVVLASGRDEGECEEALAIHADARVLGATVKAGEAITYPLAGRKGYLVPATGRIEVEGPDGGLQVASARDGVAVSELRSLKVKALEDSELVLVDSA